MSTVDYERFFLFSNKDAMRQENTFLKHQIIHYSEEKSAPDESGFS